MTSTSPSAHGRALRRGGARLRAERVSGQLTERECRLVIGAATRSIEAEMPFNRFITIAWEKLGGIDATLSVKTTGVFITLVREWVRARGFNLIWAWVQESTPGNAHCHILLHIPQELGPLFRPMPRRWAKKIVGKNYRAKLVKSERLQTLDSPAALSAASEAKLKGKVHYMLKTAPASLEGALGMLGWGHKEWGRSCKVYGKRAAVSQSLRIAVGRTR